MNSWIASIHLRVNSQFRHQLTAFKFQFWPDRWILCLGICWVFLHQGILGGQKLLGKMAFHSRVPAWHCPKWVRLRTDQGVCMLHFKKNWDDYRAAWWPSVYLCRGLFDSLVGLNAFVMQKTSTEGFNLVGKEFSQRVPFVCLFICLFEPVILLHAILTSFRNLPISIKAIISDLCRQ